jgi:serine/threonine protein kinase
MGEVYRARDPKLKRDVAIKVLPQTLARDPEILTRFEREAQAVAALSHPNILSIYDFGTQDETTYAVMELLEGESLRARLDAGPIPPKQTVDYALQIAKGLDDDEAKWAICMSQAAVRQGDPASAREYFLSPGWLRIDPNFDPLRTNPGFRKLAAGAK